MDHTSTAKKRILLSGVFGPFGVDDAFGRKENVMELFHNQVTRAQGPASLRFNHRSFGLYFLAANVSAPATVLDFPSRQGFISELERHRYDAVGISFIAPNFAKAREMARLVRRHQPWAEIILGGHGAAIDDVETLIDCDHVVKGEGIAWLRRYVGDDPEAPIVHPALPSADQKRVFGIPDPSSSTLLVPGVGCVVGCRFCATSHFFGRRYSPFFSTGDELLALARRFKAETGSDEFFVQDENFLKDRDRALRLLELMERHGEPFQFSLFSSADAVEAFGVENMARLGVTFVWIGAETRREAYEKNRGRDLKTLVRRLRDHGVGVAVSGILFLEHHTPENIQDDIDYLIGLEGDFTQFMMCTPLPATPLYKQFKREGRIDFSLPFEEWHGQHLLNFRHPAFEPGSETAILEAAFREEFDRLSSSMLRMTDTALRGYRTLSVLAESDPWLGVRKRQMRQRALSLRPLFGVLRRFSHDALERSRVDWMEAAYHATFGPPEPSMRAVGLAAQALAEWNGLRSRLWPSMRQPQSQVVRYRWPRAATAARRRPGLGARRGPLGKPLGSAACA